MVDPPNNRRRRFRRFTWDPAKNAFNIRRHGFDFADSPHVFRSPMLVTLDDREDYGEDRWVGVGLLGDRVVVIVFSEPDAQTIRVISFRKAERSERREFDERFENRLGQD